MSEWKSNGGGGGRETTGKDQSIIVSAVGRPIPTGQNPSWSTLHRHTGH